MASASRHQLHREELTAKSDMGQRLGSSYSAGVFSPGLAWGDSVELDSTIPSHIIQSSLESFTFWVESSKEYSYPQAAFE